MAANTVIAQAYRDTYSVSELEDIRAACLAVHSGSGRRSISFEGGSVTVDAESCVQVLENVMEALRMHAAEAAGDCALLSTPSMGIGFDFRNKRLT